jgi:hypothetical protein
MPNMKIISLITFVLLVSVALLHSITYATKVIVGLLLFAVWVVFAIGRAAQERRKARQSRD